MEFETGRRSTLARLQLSVQGLAGSLNSAKKVLVASTVLTAAFCGAIFGLTLVANEASKESHVSNGLLTTLDGDVVKTTENKNMKNLHELSAITIAKQDFVTFSQDGADRYMQILGVQATASKKVINTIVGAFEVTEEGMTFAGDNVVIEATEADKAARKAACKFCSNGRNAKCSMCANSGRGFAVTGRDNMCAICNNQGRSFQCRVCTNGRSTQCAVCQNQGRSNQCRLCTNGRNGQCLACINGGRGASCRFCQNGRNAAQDCDEWEEAGGYFNEDDTNGSDCVAAAADLTGFAMDSDWTNCGAAAGFDVTTSDDGNVTGGFVSIDAMDQVHPEWPLTLCEPGSRDEGCFGS